MHRTSVGVSICSCPRLYHPFIESLSEGIAYEEKSFCIQKYIPAAVQMSQKIVLKVQLNCKKCKRRAMETVAGVEGVVSVAADLKDQKITVIGDADPVCLTASLRKFGPAELVSVGPSKEPEKKPAAAKEEGEKKPGGKQEPLKEIHTCVIIPTSCNHCSSYTYYLSDDNPNACCIV